MAKATTVKIVTYLGEGVRVLWGRKFVAGEPQEVDRADLAAKCQALGCFKLEDPAEEPVAEEPKSEPEAAAEAPVAEEPAPAPEVPADGELHPELADVLRGKGRRRR